MKKQASPKTVWQVWRECPYGSVLMYQSFTKQKAEKYAVKWNRAVKSNLDAAEVLKVKVHR